jgi:perosamine synthetase
MSEVNAALGLAQLDRLDRLNERRRAIAHQLHEGLTDVEGIRLQTEQPYAPHLYHLYTLFYRPDEVGAPKDDFVRHLQEREGIEIVIRYFPIHLLPELRALGHTFGECPVAERTYFEHQVQLPLYAHLTDEQIDHMIGAVRRGVATLRRAA